MKINLFKWLPIFVVTAMCVGFASCGDDDENINPDGANSGVKGKFQGPKRVFGDDLLSSFGEENSTRYELTYNSDDFVSKIKTEYEVYEVSYSGNQVFVTSFVSGTKNFSYIFNIGSNGFAESMLGYYGKDVRFEYDSNGHLTKIMYKEDDNNSWIGTFTWQGGNLTKANDNDSWQKKSKLYTYGWGNTTGLYIEANLGGNFGTFYNEVFYYIGLLGMGTNDLVDSSTTSNSTITHYNFWTYDDDNRPIECVVKSYSRGGIDLTLYTKYWKYR